jgi:hypothetical protein
MTNKLITHNVDGDSVVTSTQETIGYYPNGISVDVDHETNVFIDYTDLVSIEDTDEGTTVRYKNGEIVE